MTPWIRKLHKWVGLIIGLQFVIWTASGLIMSLLDSAKVDNRHHLAPAEPARPWPQSTIAPSRIVPSEGHAVQLIESHWLAAQPVYRLSDGSSSWLASAHDGTPVSVTASDVAAIASRDYVGEGRAAPPQLMPETTWEVRGHTGPIWRVDFSDDDGTTLYVSGQDGRILERRNDTWRIFDFAMMLHFMDYTRQQDFNNPLIVTAGVGGLWLALSGIWLFFASFRLGDFVPARWRRRRELTVYDADGSKMRSVESHAGDTVYLALERNGLHLPSNFGGGQSC